MHISLFSVFTSNFHLPQNISIDFATLLQLYKSFPVVLPAHLKLWFCHESECAKSPFTNCTMRVIPRNSVTAARDPFGDHQIGCGGNGYRIFRHNSLRDVLFAAALSVALAPRKCFSILQLPSCRYSSPELE